MILIDEMLPNVEGFEIYRQLETHAKTRTIPQDFLALKFDTSTLRARVKSLLTEHSIAASVREVLQSTHLADLSASSELTEEERRVLASGGFPFDRPPDLGPLAEHALAFQSMLASSLTTEQAAKKLHVQPSRIRQRLLAIPPDLYGIRVGNVWRLPAFQFGKQGLVPNIDEVIARLPPGLDPVAVERWLRTPTFELDDDESPASPLAWLAAGKPWKRVAELAAEL